MSPRLCLEMNSMGHRKFVEFNRSKRGDIKDRVWHTGHKTKNTTAVGPNYTLKSIRLCC